MEKFKFITIRLGKDSVNDIKKISSAITGIQSTTFTINVRCTQIPDSLSPNDYAFIWLGSDNNKGMPTEWKQGFKAVGIVSNVIRGKKYNDTSETTLNIVYIFEEAINRMDILRCAPTALYWCSSMPLIGIDDHANQTIRSMSGTGFSDIRAFFCCIQSVAFNFKKDILKIQPDFAQYFNTLIPSPIKYPKAKSMDEIGVISEHDMPQNEIYLTALRTKPFLLLAGISGTGKSRKVQELAYATCPRDGVLDADPTSPGNYCLIEVKPNWHDSTELLGYYSNLSGKYVLTDFIRFVYKAIKHPNVPFFVCLDEMNLAPVEQYFAEYLSVLETRKRIQNEQTGENEIVSAELITKKSFQNVKLKSEVATPLERGDDVPQEYKDLYTGEDLQVVKYIKENGLRLPQNLFVIGTVNMDDTTHQFSRKVIDRAFTIEMNGGDLSSMFDAKDTLSYAETPLDAEYVVPSFAKAQEVLDAFPSDADIIKEKVPKLLDEVNGDGIFKDTPFRVSYRVENEMVLYFGSLRQFDKESSAEALINKAFLAILLEKILPRVEGDEKAMHCGTDGSSVILTSLQDLVNGFKPEDYEQGDGSLYDIIYHKLHEMNERVKTSYFTSFFS